MEWRVYFGHLSLPAGRVGRDGKTRGVERGIAGDGVETVAEHTARGQIDDDLAHLEGVGGDAVCDARGHLRGGVGIAREDDGVVVFLAPDLGSVVAFLLGRLAAQKTEQGEERLAGAVLPQGSFGEPCAGLLNEEPIAQDQNELPGGLGEIETEPIRRAIRERALAYDRIAQSGYGERLDHGRRPGDRLTLAGLKSSAQRPGVFGGERRRRESGAAGQEGNPE